MSLIDTLVFNALYIFEYLTNSYCQTCGELQIDNECDFCDNVCML